MNHNLNENNLDTPEEPAVAALEDADVESLRSERSATTSARDEDIFTTTSTPVIGKKETNRVWKLKALVITVLLGATIGTAIAVHRYTSDLQEQQFAEQFREYANKILDSIGDSLHSDVGAMDALSVDIVAHARATGQNWPLVNVPHFGIRAAKIISISNLPYIAICPVVRNGMNRNQWENFTATYGRAWVDESLELQESDKNYHGPIIQDWVEYGVVHGISDDIPYDIDRPLLPAWHTYPVIPRYPPYNYDYLSASFPDTMLQMLDSGVVTLSEPYLLPDYDDPVSVEENEVWADWLSDFIEPDENPMEPAIDISFPMFDTLNSVQADPETEIVAMVVTSLYFRDLIKNVLPNGCSGVIVVTENACSPAFSYYVSGSATFLGRGDLHNPKFNSIMIKTSLENLTSSAQASSRYVGPQVYTDGCPYHFLVYPSDELYAEHVDNEPRYLALGAMGIFLVCILIFMLYDIFVERRQYVVLTKAEKTTAVVDSLFPQEVRDRILYEHTERSSGSEAFRVTDNLISNGGDTIDSIGDAIAQLYPETTVMFSDIAGFTAWSSGRDPSQVFVLLENLYRTFDRIAKDHRVFKVETIGDSYVAVCGLPKPRKNHAVVMCQFAADCRIASSALFRDLESTLGPGTAALSIRFGLNSGPTTGGVLRGEKSRFQLFGDTVNTASRMESSGQAGRIHVSQKTAELVMKMGKGHWLSKRDSPINAKGKGALQTYWVDPRTACSATIDGRSEVMVQVDLDGPSETSNEKRGRLIDWFVDALSEPLFEMFLSKRHEASCANLPEPILQSLREYVRVVSGHHLDRPYHNLEHATHVGMAVQLYVKNLERQTGDSVDSLVRFSLLLSALIHDLGHPGGRSLPEDVSGDSFGRPQRAVTVALDQLRLIESSGDFVNLCEYLDVSLLRSYLNRFVRAATGSAHPEKDETGTWGMLENLMRVATASHRFQHFSVFVRWNELLWKESIEKMGNERDPEVIRREQDEMCEKWYQRELLEWEDWMQRNELIFLNADSVEYLSSNGEEWRVRGQELVKEWLSDMEENGIV